MHGTIKRFHFKKGFGFIQGDRNQDYFFHYSDFKGAKNQLRIGKKVTFKDKTGDKGLCAVEIQLLNDEASAAPEMAAGTNSREVRFLITGILIGIVLGVAATSAYRGFF